MQKILIIQTAFLGDVILATPVATELKRLFPNSSIDFLVRKGNESLLENHPAISQIKIFDKKNGKLKSLKALISEFRKTRYDLVINLHRFGSSGIITALSGAKIKYGFKKNPFSFAYSKSFEHSIDNGQHEVERNLSIIKEFGANKIVKPSLYPTLEQFDKVNQFKSNEYYCFAPASVWFTKQLPKEKWVELLELYSEKGTLYLLGGKDDFQLCEEIKNKINSSTEIENLAGKLNLLESAALIKDAKRTFVNDSGPMHIASAMNAPVTTFFCSTIPNFGFGPLSEDAKIVEVSNLTCRPCGLHGHKACPEGHFQCGNKIKLS